VYSLGSDIIVATWGRHSYAYMYTYLFGDLIPSCRLKRNGGSTCHWRTHTLMQFWNRFWAPRRTSPRHSSGDYRARRRNSSAVRPWRATATEEDEAWEEENGDRFSGNFVDAKGLVSVSFGSLRQWHDALMQ
jgi:hypothetical protein